MTPILFPAITQEFNSSVERKMALKPADHAAAFQSSLVSLINTLKQSPPFLLLPQTAQDVIDQTVSTAAVSHFTSIFDTLETAASPMLTWRTAVGGDCTCPHDITIDLVDARITGVRDVSVESATLILLSALEDFSIRAEISGSVSADRYALPEERLCVPPVRAPSPSALSEREAEIKTWDEAARRWEAAGAVPAAWPPELPGLRPAPILIPHGIKQARWFHFYAGLKVTVDLGPVSGAIEMPLLSGLGAVETRCCPLPPGCHRCGC